MKKYNITVGIPFYSGTEPRHFADAIGSIQEQTYGPKKIHLIQDGPVSRKIKKLVQKKRQKDGRIEHIQLGGKKGLSYALNCSILKSETSFYARMDADDISHPERLEKQIKFFNSNPEIEIIGTWAREFSSDPEKEDTFLKKVPTEQKEMEDILHYRSPFIHPSVMFRRRVFAKIGLYPDREQVEDLCLWSRAFKKGTRTANIAEPLLYFRFQGVVARRSSIGRIGREAKMRFGYGTFSPRLNALKVSSLMVRILPEKIQEWVYSELR
ncbi:glycosyltransferase [Salinibacter ruber]|uniref:glycosyltransferase n=1 Tax=Salinibacter ruber TaxID=146919 RepID=UPI0021682C42|nr:glycosyltransferase [Salinibacter ruber]MCS3643329.1 hypothetical protein [Salinibacter ruber]